MKFIIKDNPISYDEIYQSIRAYMSDKHHPPAYILIHPETRHKILISSQDEMNGLQIQVVHYNLDSGSEKGVKSIHTMFGLYLIQSEDIEPGFMILCG